MRTPRWLTRTPRWPGKLPEIERNFGEAGRPSRFGKERKNRDRSSQDLSPFQNRAVRSGGFLAGRGTRTLLGHPGTLRRVVGLRRFLPDFRRGLGYLRGRAACLAQPETPPGWHRGQLRHRAALSGYAHAGDTVLRPRSRGCGRGRRPRRDRHGLGGCARDRAVRDAYVEATPSGPGCDAHSDAGWRWLPLCYWFTYRTWCSSSS